MASTSYFTSRKRVTFTRPGLSARSAASNPNELYRFLATTAARVSDLENRAGTGSTSLKSSSPVSTPPPAASFAVTTLPTGAFAIRITNPEFRGKGGNQSHTPIQHKIQFSSTPDFAVVDTLPIGQQTYYEVTKYGNGQRKWLALSSSFDGATFNQKQILGPYTTPSAPTSTTTTTDGGTF
jgi:hypothetical protein